MRSNRRTGATPTTAAAVPPARAAGQMPPRFSVRRRDGERGTWIRLVGELDLDSAAVLDVIVAQCLDSGVSTLSIDLAGVTFCDVSGVEALLAAARASKERSGSLRLEHPTPGMLRLLVLTGTLSTLLPDGDPHMPSPTRPVSRNLR